MVSKKEGDSDSDSWEEEKGEVSDRVKEKAMEVWHETLKDVPDDYDFVIKSDTVSYPAGAQVYLSYGNMSNRDALKRYGFCLTQNKYNNIYIKLRLEQNDPEFKYRQYII